MNIDDYVPQVGDIWMDGFIIPVDGEPPFQLIEGENNGD